METAVKHPRRRLNIPPWSHCRMSLLFALILTAAVKCAESARHEYLVAFTKPPEQTTLALSLTYTNLESHSVAVETSVPQDPAILPQPSTVTVDPHTSRHVSVNSSLLMRGAGVFNSVVYVVSNDGEIAVQAFASFRDPPIKVQEACMALPVSSLTSHYLVLTHCDKGFCVIAVLARHNHTDVNVTLSLPSDAAVEYKGRNYTQGEQVTQTLQAFQALQLMCRMCNMSGTLVTASQPVAVVAGADAYQVKETVTTSGASGGLLGIPLLGGSSGTQTYSYETTDKESTMAYVPPLEELGQVYIMASTPLTSLQILVKVMAIHSGTTLMALGNSYVALTDRYIWTITIRSNTMVAITADGPLLVAQFHQGHNDTYRASGDQTMFHPVPVTQWRTDYSLFVPTLALPDAEYAILSLFFPDRADAETCFYTHSVDAAFRAELSTAVGSSFRRYNPMGPAYNNTVGVWLSVNRAVYVHIGWSCEGTIGGYLYGYGNSSSWAIPLGVPPPESEPVTTTTLETTTQTEATSTEALSTTATTEATSTEALSTTATTEATSTEALSTTATTEATSTEALSTTGTTEAPTSPSTTKKLLPSLPLSLSTEVPLSLPSGVSVTVPTALPEIPTLPSIPTLPPFTLLPLRSAFCPCVCRQTYQLEMLANNSLLVPPEQYESELVVPKDSLSSTRRKKTSAEDTRKSSSALGVYITAIPLAIVMLLFYVDFCHKGIARIREEYLKKKQEKSQ